RGTIAHMPEADVRPPGTAGSLAEPWRRWHRQRPPAQVLHLDSAAAGRCSTATLRAAAAHAEREAAVGAYVAEAEAQPVLESSRRPRRRRCAGPRGCRCGWTPRRRSATWIPPAGRTCCTPPAGSG